MEECEGARPSKEGKKESQNLSEWARWALDQMRMGVSPSMDAKEWSMWTERSGSMTRDPAALKEEKLTELWRKADRQSAGNLKKQKELIEQGACEKGRGAEALAWAAQKGFMEAARGMIQAGAPLQEGLRAAAMAGRWEMIKELMEAGAQAEADERGRSLWHWMAMRPKDSGGVESGLKSEAIQALRKARPDLDVNKEDDDGVSPMRFALLNSEKGSGIETMRALMKAGARLPLEAPGSMLAEAIEQERLKELDWMLQEGKPTTKQLEEIALEARRHLSGPALPRMLKAGLPGRLIREEGEIDWMREALRSAVMDPQDWKVAIQACSPIDPMSARKAGAALARAIERENPEAIEAGIEWIEGGLEPSMRLVAWSACATAARETLRSEPGKAAWDRREGGEAPIEGDAGEAIARVEAMLAALMQKMLMRQLDEPGGLRRPRARI